MQPKAHFIALLSYLRTEEGGRKAPASAGYRPGIKFPFHQDLITGSQNFIGTENVFPGDSVKAEITLIHPEKLNEPLYPGLDFEFYEGQNRIGRGTIIKLLDAR